MPEIVRVRYTHDAMIDVLVATPMISQNELAAMFGYSAAWISTVMNSDAFQEKLLARRVEMVNPGIAQNVNERFRGLAARSLEVLQKKLDVPFQMVPDELALKVAGLAAKGLGVGGFAPAGTPSMPAPPSDRLEKLAQRLHGFMSAPPKFLEEPQDIPFKEPAAEPFKETAPATYYEVEGNEDSDGVRP